MHTYFKLVALGYRDWGYVKVFKENMVLRQDLKGVRYGQEFEVSKGEEVEQFEGVRDFCVAEDRGKWTTCSHEGKERSINWQKK